MSDDSEGRAATAGLPDRSGTGLARGLTLVSFVRRTQQSDADDLLWICVGKSSVAGIVPTDPLERSSDGSGEFLIAAGCVVADRYFMSTKSAF